MSPEKTFDSALNGLMDLERYKEEDSVLRSIIEELQNAFQAILPFCKKFILLPSDLENQTTLFIRETAKLVSSIRSLLRQKKLYEFFQQQNIEPDFGDGFLDIIFRTFLPQSKMENPSKFLTDLIKSI